MSVDFMLVLVGKEMGLKAGLMSLWWSRSKNERKLITLELLVYKRRNNEKNCIRFIYNNSNDNYHL